MKTYSQKGGSFHPWNLYLLMKLQYKNIQRLPEGYEFIDNDDELLKNPEGLGWAIIHPTNCHVIIIHRGTHGTKLIGKDWANNYRMPVSFFPSATNKLNSPVSSSLVSVFSTRRTLIARNVHVRLYEVIDGLISNIFRGINTNNRYASLRRCIASTMLRGKREPVEEVRNRFLKNHLSTIGHSQGAIYCYVYGGAGLETIVFNPAPLPLKFAYPNNLYVARVEIDPVSMIGMSLTSGIEATRNYKIFVGSDKVRVIPYDGYNPLRAHELSSLIVDDLENAIKIGNNAIYEESVFPRPDNDKINEGIVELKKAVVASPRKSSSRSARRSKSKSKSSKRVNSKSFSNSSEKRKIIDTLKMMEAMNSEPLSKRK
jgi:hypothetical protein